MKLKKEDIKFNEEEACPCKNCRYKFKKDFYPTVVKISDLYYAHCTNPECKKYDPYEFLGTTKKASIENWNSMMLHGFDDGSEKE